ncbi:MAG: hypothetical protein K1X89_06315 [Myxococcaceae bacterium]|nr:hypothetical protein [Myxococcaceae bacterium]
MKVSPKTISRQARRGIRAAQLERPDPVSKARRLLRLLGVSTDEGGARRSLWLAAAAAVLTWVLSRVLS